MSARNLPHWELPGALYHVETRTRPNVLLSPHERTVVVENIWHYSATKFDVMAYVVMPDHFHMVIHPKEIIADGSGGKYHSLASIKHSLKRFTAHALRRPLWQDEAYDRIIRSEKEYLRLMQYIRNNPVEAELVAKSEDYPWLWHEGLPLPASVAQVPHL